MQQTTAEQQIAAIYTALTRAWGPQHWWPAQTQFEVIAGAYLTQNTSWANVEMALGQLRSARVLSVAGVRKIPVRKLEKLVRSSGYFRQKARSLKAFVEFLDRTYDGSLKRMLAQPTAKLRDELLSLNGVGPETADSILLYAGQHPVFVVDAYTRRVASRHSLLPENAKYEELRTLFERGLSTEMAIEHPAVTIPGGASHSPSRMSLASRSSLAQVYNEMHGLIVSTGKKYCLKANAQCEECPLKPLLPATSL